MKTVVCLSGGVDSTLLAAMASAGSSAVFIGYNQPAVIKEAVAAKVIARHFGLPLDEVVISGINLGAMVPGKDPVGLRVVPHRNAIIVAVAANLAARRGCECVWYGATAEDARYPDCNAEWVASINECLHAEGVPIIVEAPLLTMRKAEIVHELKRRGVSTDWCWSCYEGGEKPCGECLSCMVRLGVAK